MKLFDFGGGDAQQPAAPAGGGAAPVEPGAGSVLSATRGAADKAAREGAARSPRRRGTADVSRVSDAELRERTNALVAEQLRSLHSPKLWAAMLAMPANAAQALTGKDRWKLSDDEKETLGLSGSALAETLMITNPRALAMLMFASVMMASYGPRIIGEAKDYAAKRATAKKEEPKTP